jgi:hypothetical protein
MMNDPNDTVKSIADATKSVSDTTREGMQLVERAGAFFAKVLGEDAAGILKDGLFYFRAKNALALQEKLDRILAERRVANPKAIPLRLAIPFLEAATLEDDETLQERWARLLANAMDPDFEGNIERCFGSVLKELSPIDCLVLETLEAAWRTELDGALVYSTLIATRLRVPGDIVSVALGNLRRMELISAAGSSGVPTHPHLLGATTFDAPTEFGIAFLSACSHGAAKGTAEESGDRRASVS